MKRSEMIDELAQHIRNENYTNLNSYDLAKTILDFLQKTGMKPPLEKHCPVLLTTSHVWEKESV